MMEPSKNGAPSDVDESFVRSSSELGELVGDGHTSCSAGGDDDDESSDEARHFEGSTSGEADIDAEDSSTVSSSDSETSSALHENEQQPGNLEATGGTSSQNLTSTTPALRQYTADLMHQYSPSRMKITQQELEWALNVRNAIENIADADRLSDMMYAQLAIVSQGDVEWAVNQAYRMQEHKQDNKILDTLDDGLRNLPCEAHFLSLDYNVQNGGYIIAMDTTKTNAATWRNPEEASYFNRRSFYAKHMAHCDFEAIRTGVIVLMECDGFQLIKGRTADLSIFKKSIGGTYAYPSHIQQIKFLNTPLVFNLMVSMAKSTLPKEVTSKFHVGGRCPMGRLDKLYSIPTPEIAAARLQERMRELMARRYENEATFRLPTREGGTPSGNS